jgi:ribosomal protein L37E
MALAKCARCEKLFDRQSAVVCPTCQPDEDADYDKVRRLLNDSPNMNAEQVSASSGVELSVVLRMLDEGFLANSTSSQIRCGRCGAPAISASKKLCQACLEKLNAQVASAQSRIKLPDKKAAEINEYAAVRKLLQEKRK